MHLEVGRDAQTNPISPNPPTSSLLFLWLFSSSCKFGCSSIGSSRLYSLCRSISSFWFFCSLVDCIYSTLSYPYSWSLYLLLGLSEDRLAKILVHLRTIPALITDHWHHSQDYKQLLSYYMHLKYDHSLTVGRISIISRIPREVPEHIHTLPLSL